MVHIKFLIRRWLLTFCVLACCVILVSAAVVQSGGCGVGYRVGWSLWDDGTLFLYSNNGNYNSMPNYTYDGASTNVPWLDYQDQITSVRVSYGVKNVGSNAFRSIKKLTTVTIESGGSSVQKIGADAFHNCTSLTTFTILAKDLTTIESDAFYGCSALESFEMPNNVSTIGRSAFSHCFGLKTMDLTCQITEIAPYTFTNCTSLHTLHLSSNLAAIGESAFFGCKQLTDVYFDGCLHQWNAVTIDNGNAPLTAATHHFAKGYSDVAWNWSSDKSAASVSLTCACGEIDTVEAAIETTRIEPTYLLDGSQIWTASATLNGTVYSDKTSLVLPATGQGLIDKVVISRDPDTGAVTMTGVPEGITVILAAYNGEQMLRAQILTGTTLTFPDPGSGTWKAFFVTSDWLPVAQPKTIS